MDDRTISVSIDRCLTRQCEASRLEGRLLAQAYQQVFPQARQPLAKAKLPAPEGLPSHHKAAVAAAGA